MTFLDLPYDMPLWRPPSEGQNLIVQATIGCSFNACTFCSMYKTKTYRAKPLSETFADIEAAHADWSDAHRVFLADGDALALETDHLLAILDRLHATFETVQRVSCYATPQNLNKKSVEDLAALKTRGLSLIYVGIESGSDDILKRIRKGSAAFMRQALERAEQAGLKVSATVILGLGGQRLWREHIEATADLINRCPPKFLSTLQLGLDAEQEPTFKQAFARQGGAFVWQDDAAILDELALLLDRLDPPRGVIFRSNHASNCLPLAGTLPKDGARLRHQIQQAREGALGLRPKGHRGL